MNIAIAVTKETLPQAWEAAVIQTWNNGRPVPTEYDKPDDPNSRDVAAMIVVRQPMMEPRIHRAFPGGLNDLEKYRMEVLYGVHDHWIGNGEKWKYTYHSRLFDQLEDVVEALKAVPYSRRIQAVIYDQVLDAHTSDPPCLQRLWFRIVEGRLDMHVCIRSNDAYKAAFMNMYAFIELQATIAKRIDVPVGHYVHFADSFHIYGSYFEEFEGFLKMTKFRELWDDRTWTADFARPMFIEGCEELLAEEDLPQHSREMVEARIKELSCS